jgi:hypothetical protein
MSFPYTPRLSEEKIESLQTQHEYLNILRLRHLQWMNTADDSESERIHREITEHIEQITDRYKHLLDQLEQQRVVDEPVR